MSKKRKKKGKNNRKKQIEKFRFWEEGNNKIIPALLIDFLELQNFYLFEYYDSEIIVKLKDSVAEIYTPKKVFVFCLNYIRKEKNIRLESSFIKEGELLLMTKKGLLAGLNKLSKKLYRDTKTRGIIFFKNCFIVITAEELKKFQYSTLKKIISNEFIFESKILDK